MSGYYSPEYEAHIRMWQRQPPAGMVTLAAAKRQLKGKIGSTTVEKWLRTGKLKRSAQGYVKAEDVAALAVAALLKKAK